MVDSKHFSTSTVIREIRHREVVAKAKGVPKLLIVQRQSVFFDWNSVQPRADSLVPCLLHWGLEVDQEIRIRLLHWGLGVDQEIRIRQSCQSGTLQLSLSGSPFSIDFTLPFLHQLSCWKGGALIFNIELTFLTRLGI